jgi:hypothetical protein
VPGAVSFIATGLLAKLVETCTYAPVKVHASHSLISSQWHSKATRETIVKRRMPTL